MANLFSALRNLRFKASELSPKVKIATLVAAPAPIEVKVLFYRKGTIIPPHTHSQETIHILLSGELEAIVTSSSATPRTITALGDYRCGGWEYRAIARKDTYVLLIQMPGTTFVKAK